MRNEKQIWSTHLLLYQLNHIHSISETTHTIRHSTFDDRTIMSKHGDVYLSAATSTHNVIVDRPLSIVGALYFISQFIKYSSNRQYTCIYTI